MKERSRTVGGIYTDSWDDYYRVEFYQWDSPRTLSEEELERTFSGEVYHIEEYGHSGENYEIVKFEKVCDECGSKGMYDERLDEYYCPMCELE